MQGLLAVIGDPIEHSLSPVMHRKWLAECDLDFHYQAFRVTAGNLKEVVYGLRALDVKGFNVTIPHKQAIMPFLDEINEEAQALGAVNTVINKNGKLIGTNTDGAGFIQSLKEKGYRVEPDEKVLIVGAGGAARAVGLALARGGHKHIDIANRSQEKAKVLSVELAQYTKSRAVSLDEAATILGECRLVIQATPVGMSGVSDEIPLSLTHLNDKTYCVDLIYKPLKTQFLAEAELRGCQTMNGLPMLIHQGAIAFQHWFGIYPDTKGMEALLRSDM